MGKLEPHLENDLQFCQNTILLNERTKVRRSHGNCYPKTSGSDSMSSTLVFEAPQSLQLEVPCRAWSLEIAAVAFSVRRCQHCTLHRRCDAVAGRLERGMGNPSKRATCVVPQYEWRSIARWLERNFMILGSIKPFPEAARNGQKWTYLPKDPGIVYLSTTIHKQIEET